MKIRKEVRKISLFAIADLHLSLGTDKPMDIFAGWDHYVERLEKNWKKLITDADTVVIPGDLSWAMKLEDTVADFTFLNGLPGKKLILKGNHDLWWSTVSKMKRFFAEQGFDTLEIVHNNAFAVEDKCVCGTRGWFYDEAEPDQKVLLREAGRLETSIAAAEQTGLEPVVFLHYPPVYAGRICHEIFDVLRSHTIKRVYYGHVHGGGLRLANEGMFEGVRLRLISGDRLEFIPILVP